MHSVRSHASDFLRDLGIVEPPLREEDCLDLRRLQIAKESLDEFLRGAGRDVPLVQGKLDAMLDLQERSIWLRKGLHAHKAKLGKVHEVGHDVLPWQSAVLHYCSILDLPIAIQREWELEATAFALECLFLGGRFTAESQDMPFTLRTPLALADRYAVSYESAIRHYVEHTPHTCCLLVSEAVRSDGVFWMPHADTEYEIRYYVNSSSFSGSVRPRQRFNCAALSRAYGSLSVVTEHDLEVIADDRLLTYHAESFSNSYRVFTLLSLAPFG